MCHITNLFCPKCKITCYHTNSKCNNCGEHNDGKKSETDFLPEELLKAEEEHFTILQAEITKEIEKQVQTNMSKLESNPEVNKKDIIPINGRTITVPLQAWLAAERLAGFALSITNERYSMSGSWVYDVSEHWRGGLLKAVTEFDKAKE